MELVLASSVVGIVVGVLALVVRLVPYPEDLDPDGRGPGGRDPPRTGTGPGLDRH